MLSVGCICVDGSELWPDEAKEIELEPVLAPIGLPSLVLDFGKEAAAAEAAAPPPEEGAPTRPKASLAGLATQTDTLAKMIAFVAAAKAKAANEEEGGAEAPALPLA